MHDTGIITDEQTRPLQQGGDVHQVQLSREIHDSGIGQDPQDGGGMFLVAGTAENVDCSTRHWSALAREPPDQFGKPVCRPHLERPAGRRADRQHLAYCRQMSQGPRIGIGRHMDFRRRRRFGANDIRGFAHLVVRIGVTPGDIAFVCAKQIRNRRAAHVHDPVPLRGHNLTPEPRPVQTQRLLVQDDQAFQLRCILQDRNRQRSAGYCEFRVRIDPAQMVQNAGVDHGITDAGRCDEEDALHACGIAEPGSLG